MDIGKNLKKMKKQKLTPEQNDFFKNMEKTIDHDLATLLEGYTPEEIMRAQIATEIDKENLALTIRIKLS